jgi:hypothetical protein
MRKNIVSAMMRLYVVVAMLVLAGCGGGGGGGVVFPASVQSQAEIDAAKLATLKKVEGNWTFSYTVGYPFSEKITLSDVKKSTIVPAIDYEVTVTPSSSLRIMLGGYSISDDVWVISGNGFGATLSGMTGVMQFKTDGTNVLPGGCFYRYVDNVKSACYPLTGNKTSATPTPTPSVNVAPVANAGTTQNVVTGTIVTLDGSSSSDVNGDMLTYSWSITSKPNGSSATLVSPTTEKPKFTVDVAGNYYLSLVVNDGKLSSAAASTMVIGTTSTTPTTPTTNQQKTQLLYGSWALTYNIISTYTDTFTLNNVYASTVTPGDYTISGTNEYGGLVVGSYSSKSAVWSIYDGGTIINQFYVFQTDGNSIWGWVLLFNPNLDWCDVKMLCDDRC